MSERHDPVIDLLGHADHLAPVMLVDPDTVIDAGRRTLHRRRLGAAGVGGLTLAGALWLGGPLLPFVGDQAPVPAAISWQQGVDVHLFDNSPNAVHEADRTHWTGQLRSAEGEALPELVLTRDGEQLAPVPAEDGPGDVLVFRAEGISVAVWQSPAGSRGEWPLWAPGVYASQGADITVDDADLRYSVAETVPGATGDLEELYWFTEDSAHAASGAPVASTVLTQRDTRALVMLDEARQAWGVRNLAAPAGLIHVERLVDGAGLDGWTGEHLVATAVGVLPPGASAPTVDTATAALVQAHIGSRTAVLAVDLTGETYGEGGTTVVEPDGRTVIYAPPPTVRFTLEGDVHGLASYARDRGSPLDVGSVRLMVTGQPAGLALRRGESSSYLVEAEDLTDGRAVAGSVRGGGQVVVVPGWEPDADPEDLRVLVGTDGSERWVEAESVHVGTLFDGRPVVVLGLDRGVVGEGGSVLGVGAVHGAEVMEHELEEGVETRDLGL